MKVLLLGINYAPEPIGVAVYTVGLAERLVAAGHQVHVVAGNPYYPAWKIADGYKAGAFSRSIEAGVTVDRVPHYIPATPTGRRRLLHHITFALAAFFPFLWRAIVWRPDLILAVAPALLAAPLASLGARLCGAPSWLHIQDFEADAAIATGLLHGQGPTEKLARWFERTVLQRFDVVSSISARMCQRLTEKGVSSSRVIELRNWADIGAIAPALPHTSPFRDEWNISTPGVALYSGNIANKQGIEIIVDVARRLKHRQDLTFVVCGEGPNRQHLETLAAGLTNIQFRPLQPKDRLSDLLALATVHLLPQIAGAADLVLPSKLANMLASGRPVIATAAAGTALALEVTDCGIVVPPDQPDDLAQALETLLNNPILREQLGANARTRAVQRWSAISILSDAVMEMEAIAAPRRKPAFEVRAT